MKPAAAAFVCVGMGVLAGQAVADPLALPTVPTVTAPVPIPTVTVGVPTVPAPVPTTPIPTPTVRVPVPTAPAPSTVVAGVTAAVNTATSAANAAVGTAGSTGSASGGASGPVAGLGGAGATGESSPSGESGSAAVEGSATSGGPPPVTHFESSRPWIAASGKKSRRSTILTFVVVRSGRVFFTVRQLSPECRIVGRFSVRAHAGLNRVRFAGRVGKRELTAGTYRLTARTRTGRALARVTIVVVERGAPSRAELATLQRLNVCPDSHGFASAATSTGASVNGKGSADGFSPDGQASASGSLSPGSGGVLTSETVQNAVRTIRPALVALLAAAIFLLGLASLPPIAVVDARINDVLARHRSEIAGAGAATFIAVVIAFLLG